MTQPHGRCLPPPAAAADLPAASGRGSLPGPRPARESRRTFLLRSWTSALLSGDFLNQLARLVVVALPGDIRLRDDTEEPAVFFEQGKTAHLELRLASQRFSEIMPPL